jgi:hypothetical protein
MAMEHYTLDQLVRDRKRELLSEEEKRREREQRLTPSESRWRVIREDNGGLTVVFKPRSA